MKKLVALLYKVETGGITGRYSSHQRFGEIKKKMQIRITMTSNDKELGGYTLLVKEIVGRSVYCLLCNNDGTPLSLTRDYDEDVGVSLNPCFGNEDNMGNFTAKRGDVEIPPKLSLKH
ncbi:MAG TPA: hypothetical protein VK153_03330 [Candidatus Paceibacterota bacterium]|nr:hypothetical protein [Candidatus Paceibacterota bacterium]